MGRNVMRALLGLLALSVVWMGWVGLVPYRGYSALEVVVQIPRGAAAGDVADLLAEAGVVRSAMLFRWTVRLTGAGTRLQAGEYRFVDSMGPMAVRRKLIDGDVVLHQVTLPEGLRLDEVIDLLLDTVPGRRAELEAAGADPSPMRDLDAAATDLEGYLFPETYQFPSDIPGAELVGQMVDRFREVFGPQERRRAAELGLTVRQVITLASLVEKETGDPAERALVSSVFHNRLQRGMLLQCDPTIIFSLVKDGVYKGRIGRKDLQHESPYNTYLHPGLPPGPIASPGEEAIRAALYPSEAEFLYFVSMNDGTHHFSESLAEHQQAVNRYQRRGRGR